MKYKPSDFRLVSAHTVTYDWGYELAVTFRHVDTDKLYRSCEAASSTTQLQWLVAELNGRQS